MHYKKRVSQGIVEQMGYDSSCDSEHLKSFTKQDVPVPRVMENHCSGEALNVEVIGQVDRLRM